MNEKILTFIDQQNFDDLKTWLSQLPLDQLDDETLGWYRYGQALTATYCDSNPSQALSLLSANMANADLISQDLLARSKVFLGNTYYRFQQFDKASQLNLDALTFYKKQANHNDIIGILVNLANISHRNDDAATAIHYATEAINTSDVYVSGVSYRYAYAWNILANAQLQLGLFDRADTSYKKTIAIGEKLKMPHIVGMACHNLAELWAKQAKYDVAKAYYLQAIDLLLNTRPDITADALSGLGKIASQSQHFAEAKHYFDEALQKTQLTGNFHNIITDLHLARAALAEKQGDPAAALHETRHAVASVESLRANIVLPDDRARFSATRISAYDQLIARLIANGDPATLAEAFYAAEQSKSRTLLELLQQRSDGAKPIRRPQNVPAEWLTHEAALRQRLLPLYGDVNNASQITALESELQALRERIRIADADFGSFQSATPLTLAQVQARLPAGVCLLEYVIADKTDSASIWASGYSNIAGVWAFVITRHTAQTVRLPLTLAQLRMAFKAVGDADIRRLPHLTPDGAGRLNPPVILKSLHKFLLAPLGEAVTQAELLCVVPHGLLHYVPFHALLPEQTVLYAPSATVLFDTIQHKTPSAQHGVLALGCNLATAASARPLLYAEIEAHSIAASLGGQTVLGAAATRAAFLTQAKSYRYVHLACHGLFRPQHPMQSHLQLHDGPLDANDVLQHLALDADLVTLSACETGLSQVMRGDELMGFVRAFLYAGTPSVLVSQWVAADVSTCILMQLFYTALQHMPAHTLAPKASALAHAQRRLRALTANEIKLALAQLGLPTEIIAEHLAALAHALGVPLTPQSRLFDHTFYWAPFFMVGEQLAMDNG